MTRGILGLLAVLALEGRAAADSPLLVQARIELDAMNYPAARLTLERALATGKNSPVQLGEVFRLTGIAEASTGKVEQATAAFARWIVLVPDAALEKGISPKIAGPFAAAKTKLAGTTLEVRVATTTDPPLANLIVEQDPLALVKSARVAVAVDGGLEQVFTVSGVSPIALPLPAGSRYELRVSALDEYGNELRIVDRVVIAKEAAVVEKPPSVPPAPAPRGRGFYAQWWLWGSVAIIGAAGTAYFGLEYRADRDEHDAIKRDSSNHTFAEADEVASRMKRNALLANISLAVAGGTALAAIVLYLTKPDDVRRERSLTITPVPARDGASVLLALPF